MSKGPIVYRFPEGVEGRPRLSIVLGAGGGNSTASRLENRSLVDSVETTFGITAKLP